MPLTDLQLCNVCKTGNVRRLNQLIVDGADVNGSLVNRPLIVASERGHAECVRLLLEHGARVDLLNQLGDSALLLASSNASMEVVKILLDNGAEPSFEVICYLCQAFEVKGCADRLPEVFRIKIVEAMSCTETNVTANAAWHFQAGLSASERQFKYESMLYTATRTNDVKQVSRLLAKPYIKLNCMDSVIYSLLLSCQHECLEIVKLLLHHGADPNSPVSPGEFEYTPLSQAAQTGHVEIVKLLLQNGADANAADAFSVTPLQYVIKKFGPPDGAHDHGEVLLALIDHGVDAAASRLNDDGESLLYIAVKNSWPLDLIRKMLNCGVNPNLPENAAVHPLFLSCKQNNSELVSTLLEGNADPNKLASDKGFRYSQLPLGVAVNNGNKSVVVVEALLKYGANVNMLDCSGQSALHYVCRTKELSLVKMLLAAGADPNLPACPTELRPHYTGHKIKLPLFMAAANGNRKLIDVLLNSKVDVNARNEYGSTVLHLAVKSLVHSLDFNAYYSVESDDSDYSIDDEQLNDFDGIQESRPSYVVRQNAVIKRFSTMLVQLLDCGADVNALDAKGQTPLYMAVKRRYSEFVRRMLDRRGADPNRTTSQRYPLCLACFRNDMDLVVKLLEAGADPNVMADKVEDRLCSSVVARVPLCIAASLMNVSMMSALIRHGAQVNYLDWNGCNVFSCLFDEEMNIDDDFVLVAKLLLDNGADPN